MWASSLLTRRCKLLMAVVADDAGDVGCEVCVSEAGQALHKGGLKEAALTQILTHLDAPEPVPCHASKSLAVRGCVALVRGECAIGDGVAT